MSAPERIWTKWFDERPPNKAGTYRFRIKANILGLDMMPEWTAKMENCGGFGDPAHWLPHNTFARNGRRYYIHDDLEWSFLEDDDTDDIIWHGLDLLKCPFTGVAPKVGYNTRYLCEPIWKATSLWISAPYCKDTRFGSAKELRDYWNTRFPDPEITAQYERICQALGIALEANVDEAIAEHTAMKAEIEKLKIELAESLEETRNYAMVGNELHALVLPNDESDEPSLSDLFPAIKAMKAEIERLRDPWQPIATAPRDKEVIFGQMVKFSDGKKWQTYTGFKRVINEEVIYSVSTRLFFFCPEPTHWCELPPVPQAQAALETRHET